MIKINVLRGLQEQKLYLELQKAVEQFTTEREAKSYGDRHPELGKMFKCQVCQRRHRGTLPCIPTYVDGKPAEGAGKPRGGRILRHRNARGLQDLERTLKIFQDPNFEPYVFDDMDKRGKLALIEALRQLRKERSLRRRTLRRISNTSRKINQRRAA